MRGSTIALTHRSRAFEGTSRAWWIHLPAGLDPDRPSRVMVFNDGEAYLDNAGWFRIPAVLEDLTARRELPSIAALFVNPGHRGTVPPARCFEADHRSVEYDTVSGDFARFLETEILPAAAEHVRLSDDPEHRAIAGFSSGGICAFSAAWHRPDLFRKVMSHAGSYAAIRGGDVYPSLVERSPRRPLRVFMHCGRNDGVHGSWGNWWEHNRRMADALRSKDYDLRFEAGDGGHDGLEGGALMPESLKWLWR
jgi:enterochelin esterase family protein